MAVGSAEEAAAPKFYKHTAVFPGFLFLGVWPPLAIALLCLLSSSRMQGRARAFFVSASTPNPPSSDLGKSEGQESSREEELSRDTLVRGSLVQRAQQTQSQNQSQVPCFVSGDKPDHSMKHAPGKFRVLSLLVGDSSLFPLDVFQSCLSPEGWKK